jgi:hypothetical protein
MSVSFPCALRADPQEAPGPEILDWIGPVPAEGPVRGGLVLVGPRGAGGRTALAGVAAALAQRGARLVRLPPDPWWATSAAHVHQAIGDALGAPPAEPHPPDRAEAAEAGRLRTHLRGTPVWVVVDGLDALLRGPQKRCRPEGQPCMGVSPMREQRFYANMKVHRIPFATGQST